MRDWGRDISHLILQFSNLMLDVQFGIGLKEIPMSFQMNLNGSTKQENMAIWWIRTKDISSENYVRMRDSIEDEIRTELKMPALMQPPAQSQFEHVMGQGKSK